MSFSDSSNSGLVASRDVDANGPQSILRPRQPNDDDRASVFESAMQIYRRRASPALNLCLATAAAFFVSAIVATLVDRFFWPCNLACGLVAVGGLYLVYGIDCLFSEASPHAASSNDTVGALRKADNKPRVCNRFDVPMARKPTERAIVFGHRNNANN